ncbi:hypothetical protein CANINC_000258 [Pichia inconspicua]|uniref:CASTOR ACT domain-containing protein n=1 Tax=Pichia inconspicua TaxID=52247 RepID=A0A4V4NG98_9ASCO|nr:hypothetical protein CANINC_000258 [[Candida] inconspicua]
MINSSDTQLFKSEISVLTIPRENFWIFKSGILEIIFRLIDVYENRSNSRYSDNDDSSITSNESISGGYGSSNSNSMNKIDNDSVKNVENLVEDLGLDEIEDDGMFFHLAFSKEEVTLMCASSLIETYLSKAIKLDNKSTLIDDNFFIIQVFSDGANIGKKILELTQPLSLNNISLFFISNYFSDLVLVPTKEKMKALEILSEIRKKDDNDNDDILEKKTFELLKSKNIKPKLYTDVKLLLTGARVGDSIEVLKQTAESISRLNTENDGDQNKIFPSYFAITRTPTEEIGLLLPYDNFEMSKLNFSKANIMGSLQDYYYPIFIDLKELPLDLKGIVAGMASNFLRIGIDEMSYLSLGKSGIVLIPDMFRDIVEENLDNM